MILQCGNNVIYCRNDVIHILFLFSTFAIRNKNFMKSVNNFNNLFPRRKEFKPTFSTPQFDGCDVMYTLSEDIEPTVITAESMISSTPGWDEMINLAKTRKIRQLKKKAVLYNQGDYSSGVYYISKGKIKSLMLSNDGKEFITGLFKEGDFIGYSAILEGTDYNNTAIAIEDSEVLKIPREDFLVLLQKNSNVAQQFIKMLSENVSTKEKQLLNMAYNTVRKRIADALVQLCDKYKKSHEINFSIFIPRNDLASMTGASKETVTRSLSELKEDGFLDIKGSEVIIINYEALKKLKN
jgi:CRP-like cAMP-binding protein